MINFPSIPKVLYDPSDIMMDFGSNKHVLKRVDTALLRTRVAEAQGWRCCYCHRVMDTEGNSSMSVTLEHWEPVSKGGNDDYDNCLAACAKCNRSMGDMSVDKKLALYTKKLPSFSNYAKIAKLIYNLTACMMHEGERFDLGHWLKNKDPKLNFIMRDAYKRHRDGILKT